VTIFSHASFFAPDECAVHEPISDDMETTNDVTHTQKRRNFTGHFLHVRKSLDIRHLLPQEIIKRFSLTLPPPPSHIIVLSLLSGPRVIFPRRCLHPCICLAALPLSLTIVLAHLPPRPYRVEPLV
jgi:hypothetical protein